MQDDEVLTEKIIMFHCGSRCTYGSPRIHRDLKAAGHQVGRKRVARLMREGGGSGVKRNGKYKTTTISKHQRPKAENLVKQNFDAADPNALWASDITYISTAEGSGFTWRTSPKGAGFAPFLGNFRPFQSQGYRLGIFGEAHRRADPNGT